MAPTLCIRSRPKTLPPQQPQLLHLPPQPLPRPLPQPPHLLHLPNKHLRAFGLSRTLVRLFLCLVRIDLGNSVVRLNA